MNERTHEVDFHKYCRTCKFAGKKEDEDPCNECLTSPMNIDSRKPIKYQEAM